MAYDKRFSSISKCISEVLRSWELHLSFGGKPKDKLYFNDRHYELDNSFSVGIYQKKMTIVFARPLAKPR